jgi:threonine dehydratase
MNLTWEQIQEAQKRLQGFAHRTPVLRSQQFDRAAGGSVYFKAENLQRGGAFKFRGACNKIQAECERRKVSRIVAFSSGNHAQAVALTARLLELPATIVMPEDAPTAKIAATRGYGADIIFYDRYKEDREDVTRRFLATQQDALLVPPFDDYLVMAGQGTAAVELLEEVPDLDCLVIPVSGNGLIAGSAIAARYLQPHIKIYGVEPVQGNDTFLSIQKGERVTIEVPHTIADGLQTSSPGELTFPIVKELAAGILLVSDDELIDTILFILERMKVLVEPSGAAAAAAVRFRKADFQEKKVGVILSGGNIDLQKLREFLEIAGTQFRDSL